MDSYGNILFQLLNSLIWSSFIFIFLVVAGPFFAMGSHRWVQRHKFNTCSLWKSLDTRYYFIQQVTSRQSFILQHLLTVINLCLKCAWKIWCNSQIECSFIQARRCPLDSAIDLQVLVSNRCQIFSVWSASLWNDIRKFGLSLKWPHTWLLREC